MLLGYSLNRGEILTIRNLSSHLVRPRAAIWKHELRKPVRGWPCLLCAKPELHELEQSKQISDLDFDYKEDVHFGAKGKVGQQWTATCQARYRGVRL